ncbi:MAG: sugar phosphate nucleotidyltransferase [Kiritimatiellaeota bacterium]|nr:sugar phosphate nucleotidyltransferase [Kiritimatiellota bacterium]
MKITKAVITAAGRDQRTLPLHMLVDRDGAKKTALQIIIEEALAAGIEEIGLVIAPGDQTAFRQAAGAHAPRLTCIEQAEPRGYGHALLCARDFTAAQPFLHLVSDHLYVSDQTQRCAQQLVAVATAENCAVSAVQATRESMLPYYGAVGGHRVPKSQDLYQIEIVREKPTPTQAEQELIVPGLRAGHYLCFFGMHVLTPGIMPLLAAQLAAAAGKTIALSPALAELAATERYLALEVAGRRHNLGLKYGMLRAQLALALEGADREEVLAQLVELLAQRQR